MGRDPGLLRAFLVAIGLALALPSVQGQKFPPKVTTFTPEDFDAHNQVACVQPLSDGRTAFGTAQKVLVHDGENFRDVPVGGIVFSMDQAANGRLFVGGQGVMGVIEADSSGSLTYRSFLPMLPDSLKDLGIVWSTLCTENGEVYFDAYEHIFFYEKDTVQVVRPENRFFWMHQLPSGLLVQDLDSGLFRLRGSEKEYLKGSRELTNGEGIRAVLPSPEDTGNWTVFTSKNGLFHYDPQKGDLRPYSKEPSYVPEGGWLAAGIYKACRLDPEKNPFEAAFAVGTTRKGLYLLSREGRILLRLGKGEGIPAKQIWDLAPTGSGDLWVATNNGISLVHTGLPFTVAPEGEFFSGSFSDITRASIPDPPLFLATTQGAWRWRGDKDEFTLLPGTAGQCQDLLPLSARNGSVSSRGSDLSRILVAGGTAGLFSIRVPSEKGSTLEKADPILPHYARSLARVPLLEQEKGLSHVVAGGRDGLYVLGPEALKGKGSAKPLLSLKELPEGVLMVGADRNRSDPDSLRLWASMRSKGVLKVTVDTGFTGHVTTRYDTADGLPKGDILVFPDPDGRGVVFGSDSGLYAFEKGRFVPSCRYGETFCDGSNEVFLLEKGVKGELWIGDSKGGQVKHLLPDEDGHRVDSTRFQGLDVGDIRAIHPEKGRAWLGGDQGLASYHPEVKDDHDRRWNCLVRKVSGSGDSLLFGGNRPVEDRGAEMLLELPYSHNRLEFCYAAPFTDRQDAVTYSYRLAGFDTSWSEWDHQTRKEYTNIPEGSYTFKVKAKNVYGVESSTAEYRFRILPPWYRTWTAYGGYTVAGIGFIWLLLLLNSRRLVAQKQRLERTVEERTKEIQEEKAKVEEQKQEVEKKNQALEEANETISKQKEEVEKQQKETEKQREEAEKQKERVEEAHEEITQSIDYAQKIQYALLQSEEQVSPHLPEHFILFKPQSQVSGDFYWAREHKGHLYIAAVDCTGHGVPGAFMSMLGISQLNEIMASDELLSPGHILTELRDRVVRELSGSASGETAKDGMDAAMVKIPIPKSQSPNPKEIEFAGAQNPLYVVRKGIGDVGATHVSPADRMKPFKRSSDGIEIKGDPMPVGYDEYASGDFSTVSLQVQKGDMLYFFSDGYADQFGGPKGKKFRYGPFKQLLVDLHERSMEEQKRELDKTFEEWKAESEQEQIDDVVVVGIRV